METITLGTITAIYGDCMDYMTQLADNSYDLAIVDPPYGLPKDSSKGRGKLKHRIFTGNVDKWDKPPAQEYFSQLFRISKNQIIWGGNYFNLPPTRGFIVWDKKQPFPNFSRCEYAWTSFQVPSKIFEFDNRTGDKIHPTQKPVQLYKWLLHHYAKQEYKILDTHGGSFSHAIACHDLSFDLTIIEKDKEYFSSAVNRLKQHQLQQILKFE
jgi:site-specific DNA-methyltransferase (adenine-specific)